MLAVISPAKKLDFNDLERPLPHTQMMFPGEAAELAGEARNLSRPELQKLMKLSDSLTELNHKRFKSYNDTTTPENGKQAALAFAGDTYTGLDAATLSDNDLDYAQDHLRILSGMYGLLRPLDLIQPYRLEMGSKLKNANGGDLYDYWGTTLTESLDDISSGHKVPAIINLASNEYFKATKPKSMNTRIITPAFKEIKDGESKMIGFFAKRARGSMARYMIQNRIERVEDLKAFDSDGYIYQDNLSDDNNWVFTREQ